ncbi:MAG: translation elongation factor Ts [Flavobacteriales bacterium]|jgi:elongation factor Ts|tara:strand:+ start:209 stop:1036 length:828 start_codon:yes stop_codon:yes gene_type:complete
MKITASEVNKLRQQTGAGMMDCKKALEEAQGDFEAAVDILRLKGQKVAAKRGDREASEGLAIAKTTDNGKKAVAIILNCETDFVANNAAFGEVANNILTVAINESPASLDELKSKTFPGSELSIADKLTEEIGKIGEKIELSYYETVEGESVVAYNHPGNNLASIVSFNKPAGEDITRDVAMQVAAMAPVAVNEDSIPAEVIAKELQIGKELAIQEGKPAEMADKIAQGRLKKFFKESTLLNQAFIKDNKLSIAAYLQQKEDGLTVTEFKRASLN